MNEVILVMGVAGCGKTTIGKTLAEARGAAFLDADDYHPPKNVTHMGAGKPLNDELRWPWLDALGDAVRASARDRPTVFTCSALKRIYRDYLRASVRYRLVYPDAPFAVVSQRMAARKDHFMPVKLLRSQYHVLNPPTKDEEPIVVSIEQPLEDIIADIQTALS
ncbi:gluconate kinase, SKI family [Cognatiyoonia koreensis]|uniref:Gluconokinase n=1 Tax=Cognatiyoonia koreensis TaxID=364200 RepID=A0A1I0RW21_9RHOB|nr:gluconokinase [Cognatiyoonia koreensis]SEW45633.1 gluconate kinase, SKI family [Cognatiyoonia koreensis]